MPDFLTAAQRTLFAGPEIDLSDFAWAGKFKNGVTEHLLDDYIIRWGDTTTELNYHPKSRGDIAFPGFGIHLNNSDGRFTRKTAASIWTDPLTDWEFILSITESGSTGSPVTLVDAVTFRVFAVLPRKDRTCVVTAIQPLALWWNAEWDRETHRHATDWNAQPHAVVL